jgi:uncharacterized protein (TIGR00369 family)
MTATSFTYHSLFGEEPIHEEPRRVRWRYVVRAEHFNPAGSLHGGVISTVLDTVMGHAVRTVRPPDHIHAAIFLHVDFLNATRTPGGVVTFEGRCTQLGKRVAFCEGTASDGDGKLLARASSSYAIIAKG